MSKPFSPARQILLAVTLIAIPVAAFTGYELYTVNSVQAAATGLGDLSSFKTIVADVQALVDKGDMAAAKARITDYETAWDQAETAIRPLDQTQWGNIDQANDAAFSAIRKSAPDAAAVRAAIATLVATLDDPTKAP
jgi:hypothetical protein